MKITITQIDGGVRWTAVGPTDTESRTLPPFEARKRALWLAGRAEDAIKAGNGCLVDLERVALPGGRITGAEAMAAALDLFAAGCGWIEDRIAGSVVVDLADAACQPCFEVGGES